MDGVRKLVGERLKAQPAGRHPEAELLAAFTENALPPSERETVLDHVAKCSACRETIFLALPTQAETQQVLSPVKRNPRFALRWGTLVAAIAVAAVLIVNRDQERKPKALTQVKASAHASENTIARESAPAEFRAMHTASADKTKAAYDESVSGRPEPKHMTAKPSVAMSFEDSGQVQVSPAANADQKLEASAKDLSLRGRDATSLAKTPAGAAAQQSIGGPVAANQSAGDLVAANPLAKQTGLHGVVAGMVVDATGAAIPNAKVSATGPNGTKTAVSNSEGRFDLDQLATGNYSLKVEANGFRTTELSQVAVLDNKPAETRVTLNVGSSAETVEVSAAAAAPSADSAKMDESVASGALASNIAVARAPAQAETMEVASSKKLKNSRRAADLVTPTVFKWTIGSDGSVQRSADGKAWQAVSVASGAKFQAISSVQLKVWVGGNSGALYYSADSGHHWVQIVPTADGNKLQADITHIEFSDPQNGAITTSAGQVWTTSDGGKSWQVK